MQKISRQLKKVSPNVYALSTTVVVRNSTLHTIINILLCIGVYLLLAWSYIDATCH